MFPVDGHFNPFFFFLTRNSAINLLLYILKFWLGSPGIRAHYPERGNSVKGHMHFKFQEVLSFYILKWWEQFTSTVAVCAKRWFSALWPGLDVISHLNRSKN